MKKDHQQSVNRLKTEVVSADNADYNWKQIEWIIQTQYTNEAPPKKDKHNTMIAHNDINETRKNKKTVVPTDEEEEPKN